MKKAYLKRIFLLLLLIISLKSTAQKAKNIVMTDEQLRDPHFYYSANTAYSSPNNVFSLLITNLEDFHLGFKKFKNLKELYLASSELINPLNSFKGLENIQKLVIYYFEKGNSLNIKFANPRTLIFNYQIKGQLPLIKGCKELKELSFNYPIKMKTISPKLSTYYPSLERLYLGENRINDFGAVFLLKNLKELNLGSEQKYSLLGIGKLENLEKLVVSNRPDLNYLTELKKLKKLSSIDFDVSTFDGFGELFYNPLNITSLKVSSFNFNDKVSSEGLGDFKNVKELSLSLFNFQDSLPLNMFPKLQNLTLAQCDYLKVSDIDSYKSSLKKIHVFSCFEIDFISSGSYLKNLKKLDIDYSTGVSFHKDFFSSMDSLEGFSLTSGSVAKMHLNLTKIGEITSFEFYMTQYDNLENIVLKFSDDFWTQNPNLKYLSLILQDEDQIKSFMKNAIREQPSVETKIYCGIKLKKEKLNDLKTSFFTIPGFSLYQYDFIPVR